MRVFLLLISLFSLSAFAQNPLRIMFYNTENFFDTKPDSITNYNEFTPEGSKKWNYGWYTRKREKVYQVIDSIAKQNYPAIIGLCEIENSYVINDLLKRTPLRQFPYKYIHQDSPDTRGIDACILFRSDLLQVLEHEFINVPLEGRPTREIVYGKFLMQNQDSLHIFVNHWPSRSSGQRKSEPNRCIAASILRNKIDSIFSQNPAANIMFMGDFNDTPEDKSLEKVLNVKPKNTSPIIATDLYWATDTKESHKQQRVDGTTVFQGRWFIFDGIGISGALIQKYNLGKSGIFCPDFILEENRSYLIKQPFRTYKGPIYHGGYSDHLPVFMDFSFN